MKTSSSFSFSLQLFFETSNEYYLCLSPQVGAAVILLLSFLCTHPLSLLLTYSYFIISNYLIFYTLDLPVLLPHLCHTSVTPLHHTTITASSVCLFEWDLLPLSHCVCYYCYYSYYSVVFYVLFAHSIFNDFFGLSFVCQALLPLLRCDSCSALVTHCLLTFSTLYVLPLTTVLL